MAKIILVRHGETEAQSSLRYWGSTDIALSELGLKQAACLREKLKSEKFEAIYSSPLKRAMDTAAEIAAPHQIKVTTADELKEIDFGQVEGLTFAEVNSSFPDVARQWKERAETLSYPEGESLPDFQERVAIFRKTIDKYSEGDTIVVVAHSGTLRTIICLLLGLKTEYRWYFRIDLASISIVETYPEHAILTSLNDICHLKD